MLRDHRHADILCPTTSQFIILFTVISPFVVHGAGRIPQSKDVSPRPPPPPPPPPPVPVKFGEKDAVHDSEHIRQHLGQKIDVDKMSLNKDLETFHYFRMHDSNKDGKIDGIELMKEMNHLYEKMNENTEEPIFEPQLENMVSETLQKLDINNDGYITYAEYRQIA